MVQLIVIMMLVLSFIQKKILIDKKIKSLLEKNPYIKKEIIAEYYKQSISEYLDERFKYYCTCEEYYEPVCEDYPIEDDIKNWCDNKCFEYIKCNGYGYDDGYEPKCRNYW